MVLLYRSSVGLYYEQLSMLHTEDGTEKVGFTIEDQVKTQNLTKCN